MPFRCTFGTDLLDLDLPPAEFGLGVLVAVKPRSAACLVRRASGCAICRRAWWAWSRPCPCSEQGRRSPAVPARFAAGVQVATVEDCVAQEWPRNEEPAPCPCERRGVLAMKVSSMTDTDCRIGSMLNTCCSSRQASTSPACVNTWLETDRGYAREQDLEAKLAGALHDVGYLKR